MAEFPINKFSLKDISKWPLAFVCVLLVWLVYEFMFTSKESTENTHATLKKQVTACETQLARKDTAVAFWQAKYIMEVEKYATYFKQQDSVNRAALEKPAKDILKIVKHQNNGKDF